MGCLGFYNKVEQFTERWFSRYGAFVANNAWTLIVVSLISNVFLGYFQNGNWRGHRIYTPKYSQASEDRRTVNKLFGDKSATNFFPHSLSGAGCFGDVIFKSKTGNILSKEDIVVYWKTAIFRIKKPFKVNVHHLEVLDFRFSRSVYGYKCKTLSCIPILDVFYIFSFSFWNISNLCLVFPSCFAHLGP